MQSPQDTKQPGGWERSHLACPVDEPPPASGLPSADCNWGWMCTHTLRTGRGASSPRSPIWNDVGEPGTLTRWPSLPTAFGSELQSSSSNNGNRQWLRFMRILSTTDYCSHQQKEWHYLWSKNKYIHCSLCLVPDTAPTTLWPPEWQEPLLF